MKVFISWSGAKSREVAVALRQWIPDIIQTVEPWMSELDIDAGARWSKEIAAELGDTKFGIICLTKGNHSSPWILFETGALAKTLTDTFVCPYLIDLEPSEIPQGPLTQFQAKHANEKETWELIATINKALKDGALPEEKLRRAFERWWPDLRDKLQKLPTEREEVRAHRSVEDMIEEILNLVRGLSRRSTKETALDPSMEQIYLLRLLESQPARYQRDQMAHYIRNWLAHNRVADDDVRPDLYYRIMNFLNTSAEPTERITTTDTTDENKDKENT